MSEAAIEVQNLGKRYRLHSTRHSLRTLLRRSAQSRNDAESADFWALQNVSFTVNQGEAVGIIGHNGSGKTTLLKILSGITRPSTGQAIIRGRVSSLLAVGVGIHEELTGRENAFFSGALLGMKRTQVQKRLPDIIAFAELEHFIDTPMKLYSSGMQQRLSFAVAAHLDMADILLVDEALALGDAAFVDRCLARMSSLLSQGKTLLYVSHNLSQIVSLTQKCLYLRQGRVAAFDESQSVVNQYLGKNQAPISNV